jgi:hypothetical protein
MFFERRLENINQLPFNYMKAIVYFFDLYNWDKGKQIGDWFVYSVFEACGGNERWRRE